MSTIHQTPATSQQPLFTIHQPTSISKQQLFFIHWLPATIYYPPATSYYPPDTSNQLPFTNHHHQRSIPQPPPSLPDLCVMLTIRLEPPHPLALRQVLRQMSLGRVLPPCSLPAACTCTGSCSLYMWRCCLPASLHLYREVLLGRQSAQPLQERPATGRHKPGQEQWL